MCGLALEGGAARGAYHIGVIRALRENGYDFDGFVGTSVGAINAALFAQGDFDEAAELWSNMSLEQIFTEDFRFDKPSHIIKSVTKAIRNGGADTNKLKALIEKYIDEERLRKTGKDFGLVTMSLKDRKQHRLMLEDIPQGELNDYLMASAGFPGFRGVKIGGNTFADGALCDICPYRLLTERGYEVIAIRTNCPVGVFRKVTTERVSIISPSENLGNPFLFSPENSARCIAIGYNDGMRLVEAGINAAY
jgi:NTE family protein